MQLLRRIERHLERSGTRPSRFGREAASDPRLVADLRRGRRPGSSLATCLSAYLDQLEDAR